jgi:hypothetical protein
MTDLLAQLVEQRDDVALWTVFGDQLQAENDPRGALIAMMLERERAPSHALFEAEYAYRVKHVKALLPRVLLRPCIWCGSHFCESCSMTPSSGATWCKDCVQEAAKERDDELRAPTAAVYDDEVYDAEVAEDVAEAKALLDDGSPYDEDEFA